MAKPSLLMAVNQTRMGMCKYRALALGALRNE